ncbi:MAG: benzoate-CoA ligase family protein [Nevskiaceae bacterium]
MTAEFPDRFNLADYFLYDRLKEGLGRKTAIRYGERRYSYAGVAERAAKLGAYLQGVGLKPEERVYIVLPDTPPFAWGIFATWTAGGVLAMGNPLAPLDDLKYVVDYIQAKVIVTTPKVAADLVAAMGRSHLEQSIRALVLVPETPTGEDPEQDVRIPPALRDTKFPVIAMTDAIARAPKLPRPETHRDDMACWLFTSGSTGKPKAAMHCHRDFAFNTEAYARRTIGYRREDVTVSVPRLFFGYATGTNLWFPFAVGATTALYSEPASPEALARAIEMYKPTVVTNVPTMIGKLLAERPDLKMKTVRFQLSAGEALPPTLLKNAIDAYGTDIYDGIGSAEMFHIYCSNRPGDIKPGSLGRVVEGYELKILPADAEGPGAEEVKPGDTGVLWVKGESVSLGYYRDRARSWKTFHGHWCRTGDLFSKDADGYLWFQGRADDLFKVNGRWVAPQEVEECLLQHPAVAACVVVPFKVEGLDKPRALVVLKPGHRGEELAAELQQHVRERRGNNKWPRVVEFVDDLPRNDRGKVDRKKALLL